MTYFNELGQGRIGWKSPGSGFDTDAQAFITAAEITGTTQQSAIDTLVKSLKSANIWNKMKAIYPFVGGTAAQHRFNLKDPRTVNAAFYLDFMGGGNHSATGYQPNGTTAYADTKLMPVHALTPSSGHLSIYSRTNIAENGYDIGVTSGNNYDNMIASRYGNNKFYSNYGALTYPTVDNTDSRGFFITNRNSATNTTGYKNGINVINASQTGGVAGFNVFIGALKNDTLGITNFSSKEQAFASIGDGLTDAEAANFYTAVQTFQTTLGRQVGVPIVADTDAQAFLNAAVITATTQATAITTLVTDLKAANIWSKMKAIYPFVGGTAEQHRWNLKDTTQFKIDWFGGGTHGPNGYQPNGNSYGNTNCTGLNTIQDSTHLSTYLRTDTNGLFCDMGLADTTGYLSIFSRYNASYYSQIHNTASVYIVISNPNSLGLHVSNRTASNVLNIWKNGTKLGTGNQPSSARSSKSIFISAYNDSNLFGSPRQTAFSSIGDGLTDGEATAFYTAVQKYQTTLGRTI